MAKGFHVAAIGELLWDMLPSGPQLGGAPANFSVMSETLAASCSIRPEDEIFLISRIGDDPLGLRALKQLAERSLNLNNVSIDSQHPTGTVLVELDASAAASYRIGENAAWDFIPATSRLLRLAPCLDAICFGTLAQRSPGTRNTLRKVVESTAPSCFRVFDANLRTPYWTSETLAWGCNHSTILKMNLEEVPQIARALHMPLSIQSPNAIARYLLREYGIEMVAITRGAQGSLLVTREGEWEHDGVAATVVDTIGAGDAFTAALTYCVLRQFSVPRIAEVANRCGAWVAARHGGMPTMYEADRRELRSILEPECDAQKAATISQDF